MRYYRKMEGERIYLSPMNADDADTYAQWLNDKAVSGNLGNYGKTISLAAERRVLEDMTTQGHNYAIVRKEDDTLIGNLGLMEPDYVNRTATVGIFIGDAENRGRGYGSEALRLILDYGFNTLNLGNIMLQVHSDNENAVACYRKVGFKEFGRRRQCKFKDGRYVDVIHMDMLSGEFNA